MNLAKLKQQIQELEEKHGPEVLQLEVFTTESHEYWGTLLSDTENLLITEGPADGPKKPSKKCIVIS